jgi:nucleoside 2-deoxyribosyltransferase
MLVYLSGPISGLSYDDATKWRNVVADTLDAFGIKSLDPMRDKESLMGEALLGADTVVKRGIDPRDIFIRDLTDVMRCDVMLVNLTQRIDSIGTIMEIGWARAGLGKFIILVTTPELEKQLHPFIPLSCNLVVHDMRHALNQIVNMV